MKSLGPKESLNTTDLILYKQCRIESEQDREESE